MLPELPQDLPRPSDPYPRPAPPRNGAPAHEPEHTPPGDRGGAPVKPLRLERAPAHPPASRPAEAPILAALWPRAVAILVDFFILAMVESILLFGSNATAGGVLWFVLGGVYQWYFLVQRAGQTPGKMLLRIRVVKVDGSPLKTPDALLRFAGYVINSLPVLFGMGWAWAFIDSRRQGWHDKLARTLVVTVPRPAPGL